MARPLKRLDLPLELSVGGRQFGDALDLTLHWTQSHKHVGPMSGEAEINLATTTFALQVVCGFDWKLQHRSHYGNRAFYRRERMLRAGLLGR